MQILDIVLRNLDRMNGCPTVHELVDGKVKIVMCEGRCLHGNGISWGFELRNGESIMNVNTRSK